MKMSNSNPAIRKSDHGFSRRSELEPILSRLGRKFIPSDVYHVFDFLGYRDIHVNLLGKPKSDLQFTVVNPDDLCAHVVRRMFCDKLPVYEFSMLPDDEVLDTFIMNPNCPLIDKASLLKVGSKELINRKVFVIEKQKYDILEVQTFFMNIFDQVYKQFKGDRKWDLRWDEERGIDVSNITGEDVPAPPMEKGGKQGDRTRWVFGLLGRKVNSSRWKNVDMDITLLNDKEEPLCLVESARSNSNQKKEVAKTRRKKKFYITEALRGMLNLPSFRVAYGISVDDNENNFAAYTEVDTGDSTPVRLFDSLQELAERLDARFPR